MATNHVQDGKILTLPAPTGGVVSGTAYLFGALLGVALATAAEGEDCAFAVEGVWTLPKVSAQAWTAGARVYWDNAAKNVTTVATSNTLIGCAAAAAANPSAEGAVRLNGAASKA